MKTRNYILAIALGALSLGACQSHKDSKGAADSANEAKDTSRSSVSDTAKAATPAIKVDENDAKFAVEAANGGMSEVVLGKLASEKATNKKVKDFGTMMVTDHSKANDELKALAHKLNITLPDSISSEESKTRDDLAKKSGADFDKDYVKDMVDDHKKDVKAFEDAAKNCKDSDLKAFANKTLPTLKMHLEAIEKIKKGMK
jgi:putative membrane protein